METTRRVTVIVEDVTEEDGDVLSVTKRQEAVEESRTGRHDSTFQLTAEQMLLSLIEQAHQSNADQEDDSPFEDLSEKPHSERPILERSSEETGSSQPYMPPNAR